MSTSATPKSFVAYVRVSTRSQEASGLGLDAQKHAVGEYVARAGGVLLQTYIEIESGKSSTRPQLKAALTHAQSVGATLLVAKLDRLSRNVAFLSTLMESGVDFIAVDQPSANKLTIHVLAAVAEAELSFISERTKAGLQMARARGRRIGTPQNLTEDARRKGRRVISQQARDRYRIVGPLCVAWRKDGATLEEIALRLTQLKAELTAGTTWFPATVRRVLLYMERWSKEDDASSVA